MHDPRTHLRCTSHDDRRESERVAAEVLVEAAVPADLRDLLNPPLSELQSGDTNLSAVTLAEGQHSPDDAYTQVKALRLAAWLRASAK